MRMQVYELVYVVEAVQTAVEPYDISVLCEIGMYGRNAPCNDMITFVFIREKEGKILKLTRAYSLKDVDSRVAPTGIADELVETCLKEFGLSAEEPGPMESMQWPDALEEATAR